MSTPNPDVNVVILSYFKITTFNADILDLIVTSNRNFSNNSMLCISKIDFYRLIEVI